ncbi:hypothetical protein M231_00750 [Tremella mesenterica]|uniref:U3 small nucleolar RNA-associated protein 6 N-terminal domain-containing protein n=1 Tax=Tremella mesenterica TaxID=5217 RepID=A0A4Q1BV59_TREME|nr:hypothetical protein M231_00750 [Tremella mesenterica]
MDKVQYQLESTLPELKDLHEKGLFSKNEIDEITRRRTTFETALIRRKTRKEDYFRYAEYEINLEVLRRIRWKRLSENPPPPSISTYSLPRRTLYILKRATVKFPSDLAVWLAYIEYASREGMRKVVAKGLNNALQQHPLSPTLYLLSSYHHLHPNSPFPSATLSNTPTSSSDPNDPTSSSFSLEGVSQARTTLLLGLRLLPQSRELWREYIKLELGWVEALRRRWKLLGLKDAPTSSTNIDDSALVGGEGAFGPEGEDARKAILNGQLVVHALTSALEAIPANTKHGREGDGISFRNSLLDMLRIYPSPLRNKALEVVYEQLGRVSDGSGELAARARMMVITSPLFDRPYDSVQNELEGVELVEALGKVGKEVLNETKKRKGATSWLAVSGDWVIEQIKEHLQETELRTFFLSILSHLTKPSLRPPASLLSQHLDLMLDPSSLTHPNDINNDTTSFGAIVKNHTDNRSLLPPEELLQLSRTYASIHASDASLQRRHIALETSHGSDPSIIRKACREAIKCISAPTVSGTEASIKVQNDVYSVYAQWLLWEQSVLPSHEFQHLLKKVFRDTMRLSHLPLVHHHLLCDRLVAAFEDETRERWGGDDYMSVFNHAVNTYRPRSEYFVLALSKIHKVSKKTDNQVMRDLQTVYEAYRGWCKTDEQRVEATLTYVRIMLAREKAREANEEYERAKREVKEGQRERLEVSWVKLLEGVGKEKEGDEIMEVDREEGSNQESEMGEESEQDLYED